MLTDMDRAVLAAADLSPRERERVSVELGLGLTGLDQRLVRLLDDPDAEREAPAVVARLRRVRDQRRAARARTWGMKPGNRPRASEGRSILKTQSTPRRAKP